MNADLNSNKDSHVNVLLIDDDDGDAKAVQRAFRKAKILNPFFRAIDGLQALEILRGENGQTILPTPYILLVDLNMPRMNGLQLIQKIREDVALKKAVVFVLTTSKNDEDRAAAYNLNVSGYVLKEKAGEDFMRLIAMMDCFWNTVEMP